MYTQLAPAAGGDSVIDSTSIHPPRQTLASNRGDGLALCVHAVRFAMHRKQYSWCAKLEFGCQSRSHLHAVGRMSEETG